MQFDTVYIYPECPAIGTRILSSQEKMEFRVKLKMVRLLWNNHYQIDNISEPRNAVRHFLYRFRMLRYWHANTQFARKN